MLQPWLAQMDTFIVGQHLEKLQRVLKINASAKILFERMCDFKMYAISVLNVPGCVCAPDKATLMAGKPCSSVYYFIAVQRRVI